MSIQFYTIIPMPSAKPKRHNIPINVLIRRDQKTRLAQEFERTHVNQSAMVRKALDILFDQMDRGQLRLGFSELETEVS
jgi:hypothetical protein